MARSRACAWQCCGSLPFSSFPVFVEISALRPGLWRNGSLREPPPCEHSGASTVPRLWVFPCAVGVAARCASSPLRVGACRVPLDLRMVQRYRVGVLPLRRRRESITVARCCAYRRITFAVLSLTRCSQRAAHLRPHTSCNVRARVGRPAAIKGCTAAPDSPRGLL